MTIPGPHTSEPWLRELYELHHQAPFDDAANAEWTARAGATVVALVLDEDWDGAHAALRAAVTRGPEGGLPLLRCWLRASIGLFHDGRDMLDVKITDEIGIPTIHGVGASPLSVDAAAEKLGTIIATGRSARSYLARARAAKASGQIHGPPDPLEELSSDDRVTLGWQLVLGYADWIRGSR